MRSRGDPSEVSSEQSRTTILSYRYPISHRTVVKKTFPWLIGFLVCAAGLGALIWLQAPTEQEVLESSLYEGVALIAGLLGLVLLVRALYETLYRYCYYYAIEAGHLVISKGILLKQRGSFPLSRITDIYLDRSLGDFVLGLCDLHVSTPTVHSGRFARIDGLSLHTAVALQEYLTGLLEAIEQNHLTGEQINIPARLKVANAPALVVHSQPLRAARRRSARL